MRGITQAGNESKYCVKCGVLLSLNDNWRLYNGNVCNSCVIARKAKTRRAKGIPIRLLSHRKDYSLYEKQVDGDLFKNYGIRLPDYLRLVDGQHGRCAICKRTSTGARGRRWHVDHNKITGKLRELLCQKCNLILGHAKEDPVVLMNCIKYLLKHSAPESEVVGT